MVNYIIGLGKILSVGYAIANLIQGDPEQAFHGVSMYVGLDIGSEFFPFTTKSELNRDDMIKDNTHRIKDLEKRVIFKNEELEE